MSLVLNTNISSLISQNNLSSSGARLSMALQQLSSGLRINTAADDAAGYAIAQGMTSQINGLGVAARNANDGVSLVQTAGGALQEVTQDLQTMRDLAVQSLNASNSAGDRADLDAQFQQLKADINAVAANTQFNGVNLLDGSFQGATFQVGANVGQTIVVSSVSSTAAKSIGGLYTAAGATAGSGTTAGDTGTLTITDGNGVTHTTDTITWSGNVLTDLKTAAAAINQFSTADGGLVATVNAAGTGLDLSSTSNTAAAVGIAYTAGTTDAGTESLATIGIDASYDLTAATVTAPTSHLDTGDVTSVDNANKVVVQIDAALQQLATVGAQIGAYQNRFQAAITGLNTDKTNLTAARSQIQDTDYAAATAELSKSQILQQASTSMVAQANTIPQNILTLLQKLP